MKDSEPLWITDKMVEKPCTFIIIGYLFLLIMGGIAQSLGYFDMNENTQRDMLIWDD